MLKVLISASNQEIFERFTMQDYTNAFLSDRVEPLLSKYTAYILGNSILNTWVTGSV